MVSQYGFKFAIHLVTNHFGKIVAKVCETLFRKGPLSLGEIIRCTELTPEQVKNSLLVLVQHNCVQAYVPADQFRGEDGSMATVEYLALFDNIIHRLRFPKFLEIAKHQFDDECEKVLDGLLRDGRLTLKQMIERAVQGKENPGAIEAVVRESFHKLLKARYIERCPAPEPVISTLIKAESAPRKRGSKMAKKFEAPETIEQRVLEAAVPGEAIRFAVTAYTLGNADREAKSDDSSMVNVGDNSGGIANEGSILWRANFEEFIRHLRHKLLVENERKRLDDGAATILSAILDVTKTVEKKVKIEKSVPLSLDSIFTEVTKTEHGRTMTIDRVRASLVQLGCPQRNFDDSYSIDLKSIVEMARNEEVESIVLKRFGSDAYRIFRLLSKSNCFLETDKIAESALVDKKETPRLLYKLWKDNYLYMEKLVVTAAKQSRFMLWKVNKPLLWEYVLDEMYHAALNLSLRLAFEQEKDEDLLHVPADKLVPADKSSEANALQKRYRRLRDVLFLMGSSLMKLDDALMLFHDF
ncbi:hypothetical protein HN51_055453 [Arachis hypogaea]|uniref:DNA-directed RNA polymerase III subunit RPC3 n=2 Tax=Arachis hypogaea TaxID=3818 RepID=A0A6B9VAF5_ARAHY|nr:DNA-directed RNA polymerase III subunit RPC3 [Arachis ipaensis]XP_016175920.1 DNA-directed RNA polymerase III subunit RPC3 [Arachis ipaensis]XP_025676298.1 DNA-directed RNA polymerase III subunit RPC3 [Arachis hypogaea]XP_025676300.1 DNA-directed RNA polymerase III subunit RPC3 [Arachis hypogaea]QHN78187.1 DNA-directed RNA polymerase III subunit [Arachis hypogaea]